MAFLIIGALLIPPGLAYVGAIDLFPMFLAEVGILLLAAWRFDRGRTLGARDPYLDENRPDYSTSFTNMVPPVTTEAIEQPKDRVGRI